MNSYEMVIGLEVHVELATKSKIFCGCSTKFGAAPNTQCCPVCAGMPGVLPVLNEKVVDYAIKAGLATDCTIARFSKNDRKNYFYPDLPKAYQISQFDLPLCFGGHVDIATETGEKRIGITRIHIEEDAGKLVHDDKLGTLMDLNRCGVPLIEIVSEPDIRSASEAIAYLRKLRSIILYTGVSDAKMNEGSFRCDVNLSVRKHGSEAFGTRTEMKNLNSFAYIEKAIAYEYQRQADSVEKGEKILQETRRFDPASGKTFSMRTKEDANDYRYFPDPDLLPIVVSPTHVQTLQDEIPVLPDQRRSRYQKQYGLSAYHSEMLVLDKEVSDLFESAAALTRHRQPLASFMISEVFRMMNEEGNLQISDRQLADISTLLGEQHISSSGAKKLLSVLWGTDADAGTVMEAQGLAQLNDMDRLREIAEEILGENPAAIQDYHAGKTAALQALMGKAMGRSHGKANPALLKSCLVDLLGNMK